MQAVQDFKQALLLDPSNAELLKLLNTARDKYQEVEGVPLDAAAATEEGEVQMQDASGTSRPYNAGAAHAISYLQVQVVQGAGELLLPGADAELVSEGNLLVALSHAGAAAGEEGRGGTQARFVRVSIVSEDDSDSDSEGSGAGAGEEREREAGQGAPGFCRVAITEEDDSSSDDEDAEGEGQAGAQALAERERQVDELKEAGNQLMKAGKLLDAVSTYTRCLDLLPTYLPALNNRAQAHISLKVRFNS